MACLLLTCLWFCCNASTSKNGSEPWKTKHLQDAKILGNGENCSGAACGVTQRGILRWSDPPLISRTDQAHVSNPLRVFDKQCGSSGAQLHAKSKIYKPACTQISQQTLRGRRRTRNCSTCQQEELVNCDLEIVMRCRFFGVDKSVGSGNRSRSPRVPSR